MAKAVSLNNKQTLPYVEALVEAEGNRQRLADAAAARWGEVGRPLAAGDFAATLLDLADLPFQIEGDTAFLPQRDEPVLLRKTAGLWKMDWASVAQHLDVAEGARWLRADAMATARTTEEVKAGTYKTAQEAACALNETRKALAPPRVLPTLPAPPAQ
jgi:hypothetical protein